MHNPFQIDLDDENSKYNSKNDKQSFISSDSKDNFTIPKEERSLIRYKNSLAMLALCNNVNPSYEESYEKDNVYKTNCRVLQASSPDEKSFVEFTDEIGFYMLDRNISNITIRSQTKNNNHKGINRENHSDLKVDNENLGTEMNYEELVSVPFRSETKRMRNVIKTQYNDKYILMIKGAESEIVKLLKDENEKNWLLYKSKDLSKRGLRTLAFA